MEYFPDAFVKERRPLRTLVKITAKKKHPNLITFTFKERCVDAGFAELRLETCLGIGDPVHMTPAYFISRFRSDSSQTQRRFMLPNGRECSKEVSQLVLRSVQGS
jgi:hypothetical protein